MTNSAPALFGRHSDDRLGFGSPPTFTFFRAADIGFVDFDLATEIVSSWDGPSRPQLVQPSPGGLIATKPQFPLEPERLIPFFWLVMNHIARNHSRNGLRVSWNTVPAVKVVSHSQARHRNRSRDMVHGSPAAPHPRTQIHSATASAGHSRDRRHRCGTIGPFRERSGDNRFREWDERRFPSSDGSAGYGGCEGDTH